jgi:hypothetical protein
MAEKKKLLHPDSKYISNAINYKMQVQFIITLDIKFEILLQEREWILTIRQLLNKCNFLQQIISILQIIMLLVSQFHDLCK